MPASRKRRTIRSSRLSADPSGQPGHQDVVVHPVEELLQVQVHHDPAPLRHVFRACSNAMCALVQAGSRSWTPKRSGPESDPAPAGSPAAPAGLPPLGCPIVAFLRPAWGSPPRVPAGVGSSRPAASHQRLLVAPNQSARSWTVIPSTPGLPLLSAPAGTLGSGSPGRRPAPSVARQGSLRVRCRGRLLPCVRRVPGSARAGAAGVRCPLLLLRVHRVFRLLLASEDSALRPVGLLWPRLTSPAPSRPVARTVVRFADRAGDLPG